MQVSLVEQFLSLQVKVEELEIQQTLLGLEQLRPEFTVDGEMQ